MSGECSICLSRLKDPVSIPCGHIYCTKCLSDHVNAPNNEDVSKSTCPTCRTPFNTVTPDLTYLPRKYHQYVVPSVRRVYFDTTRQVDLQNKFSIAEAKIKKLEKDQETLLRQCERYMHAASAHAEGERAARAEIDLLRHTLNRRKEDYAIEKDEADQAYEMIKDERDVLYRKYQALKKRHSDLKQKQTEVDTSNASLSAYQCSKKQSTTNNTNSSISIELHPAQPPKKGTEAIEVEYYCEASPDTSAHVFGSRRGPRNVREIRPMPVRSRMKGRSRPASPPPMFGGSIKRQRLSTE